MAIQNRTSSIGTVMNQAKAAFEAMTVELQSSVESLTREVQSLRSERDNYAQHWPMAPEEFDNLRSIVRETARVAEKQGISRHSYIAVTYLTLCAEAQVRRSVYIPHRMEPFARQWIERYSIPAYKALRDKAKLRQFDDFVAWMTGPKGMDHSAARQIRKYLVLLAERNVLRPGMAPVSRRGQITPVEQQALEYYQAYLAAQKAV